MRVGLIGVGLMGAALMSRLQAAGREVQVYDISDERMRLARELGAVATGSVAERRATSTSSTCSCAPTTS